MTTQMTKTLLAALAALTVASAVATTAAQAKDGCGRGMAFNGRQCVMRGGDAGFRGIQPGISDRGGRWSSIDRFRDRGDRWDRRGDRGDRGFDRRDRGVTLGFGGLGVRLGDGRPRFSVDL
jgi:hypothetical protein